METAGEVKVSLKELVELTSGSQPTLARFVGMPFLESRTRYALSKVWRRVKEELSSFEEARKPLVDRLAVLAEGSRVYTFSNPDLEAEFNREMDALFESAEDIVFAGIKKLPFSLIDPVPGFCPGCGRTLPFKDCAPLNAVEIERLSWLIADAE